jgi:hypothetical protein
VSTCAVSAPVALCGDGRAVTAVDARHERVDLAVVFDTTASMSGWLEAMVDTFPSAADTLVGEVESMSFGFASFDDYNSGGMGADEDKPFILRQQQTSDRSLISAALAATPVHGGRDGPESGHEALHQALGGAGYDQNCNGRYDVEDDVRPFMANPLDAFGGAVAGPGVADAPGGGVIGGMGFREGALPVVVLVTDNHLRDPDDGYASPGGCALDAGFYDATTVAADRGAKLVGMNMYDRNEVGRGQMEALAIVTDTFMDLDGDGLVEPAVWEVADGAEMEAALVGSVRGLVAPRGGFDEVSLTVLDDPDGLVRTIAPAGFVDVAGGASLDFTVIADGDVVDFVTPYPVQLALRSGDYVLAERTVYIDR